MLCVSLSKQPYLYYFSDKLINIIDILAFFFLLEENLSFDSVAVDSFFHG